VLVCSSEVRRESIARQLADHGYQVFVAEDTRQAVERMRENQLDVVLLDPDFDPAEQGAAFVTREVNILRPAQRRRLFFGLLSPSLRTLDAHSAFLNNANVTINVNDLDELHSVLDDSIREYNELYSDFYKALNIPAI
jgi:CheY-like chemotaxis protein